MSERWFFALWPDPSVRDALTSRWAGLVPVGARASSPADLHLTLAYLGELTAAGLACAERAASGAHATPFELLMTRLGVFARTGVLWCAPRTTPEPLSGLVADLSSRLSGCGIPGERRPYRPHMTIARKVRHCPVALLSAAVSWNVREFVLAAGRSGRVPRYEIRRRWPLASGPGAGRDAATPYDLSRAPMQ